MIPIKLLKKIIILSIENFVYCINMQNLQQNNEIEHINKEINLLQDLRKTKKKINFRMG